MIRQFSIFALAAFAGLILPAQAAEAEETVTIGFEEALRLARDHAPELQAARAQTALTQAGIESAGMWRNNPALSVSGGPRVGAEDTSVDFMFGVLQPFVPGGHPNARTDLARARHDAAMLTVREEERQVVADAGRAFAVLLYWQRRSEVATRNLALATEIEAVAKRRAEVGDVGALEPAVASLARSRVAAGIARVHAETLDAANTLRWLLGISDDVELEVEGDLRLLARAESGDDMSLRSDVALANAEVEVARAGQRLAERQRYPRFAIGAQGGREENATIIRGVLELTLPLFWRGQSGLLEAAALERSSSERAAVVASRATHEVRASRHKVSVLDEAVARFMEGGLTAVAKTAEIASASYRAGALPLPELLVVRRELVAAEEEFAELMLLAALARIELLERTGVFKSNNKQPN